VLGRATQQADGGVVVVLDDVTEVRRLERVRKDFVANVSHELRTPISVIKANAETLLEGALDDPPAARRFVEGLYRHADRLGRLVSDLLDISRLESGRRELAEEAIPLAEVVDDVVESLLGEAAAKGVVITSVVSDEIEVQVDPKALEQVFFNLLDNAIKYSPRGSTVELVASVQPDGVRVEVRDDGPGIDPKHRERIFERFYRVDPGRSREMGGTGLGLSIVKHLVESMSGELGVEPRRPRGSVFWLRLPQRGDARADRPNPSQADGFG
jgi:two-component system phosphate regulon sensor histidine kinase PhoR